MYPFRLYGHLKTSRFMFWIDISVFLRNGNYKLSIKDIFILEKTESRKYGVNLSEFCQFSAKEKSAHSDPLRIKMNAIFYCYDLWWLSCL